MKKNSLVILSFLIAAVLTGVGCVYFMWGFDWVLEHRLDFTNAGAWAWLWTPLGFLLAVELIRRLAPFAAGTGIPQAVFAAENLSPSNRQTLSPLLSPRTFAIKTVTLLVIVAVGASTGREGPTVHIATGLFILILGILRKLFRVNFDWKSAVVAGAAAGLAAAFNTPLAGVTFAIEELTPNYFASIKDFVLMAIIAAAITAKYLTGEYAYFGYLAQAEGPPIVTVIAIGILGGALGAAFSTALLQGQKFALGLSQNKIGRWLVPVGCALLLLAIARQVGVSTLGPGNPMAQSLLQGQVPQPLPFFILGKIGTTLATYWSGAAGGIFAPCLSVGSALGAWIAQWTHVSLADCALVGMAAFLAGTIQAPITTFVIIFEMTNQHSMLLPVMLASFLAFVTARTLGARHFYQTLAGRYEKIFRLSDSSDVKG